MRILLAVVLLSLASCGADLTPLPPGDLAGLQRPGTPNTALAAPAGFSPKPDTPTRRYTTEPGRLYAALRTVILARPRTKEISSDPARMRADFVQRSLVFRFPDLVSIQVLPAEGGSEVVIYSKSVYGHSDFGVNRKRVAEILAALDAP